jgi:hypothetical protein
VTWVLKALLLQRRRRRSRPKQAPVPLLACPHCRHGLPERPGAYALFAKVGDQSVRASVDLEEGTVYFDANWQGAHLVRVAAVVDMGTEIARLSGSVLHCGMGLRRRLPDLARHAWRRAVELEGAPWHARRAWEGRPLTRNLETKDAAAPGGELPDPGEATWPGIADEETITGREAGADPRLDVALRKINIELDQWADRFGPERAPECLRDPVALCSAIALVLTTENEHNPGHAIALCAGAMVRVIQPPTGEALPPDPFEEGRT